MNQPITTLAQALESTNIEMIDVQKAGAIVVYVPEVAQDVFPEVAKKITDWAKTLGVNVLVLPDDIKLQVIPHDLVGKPIAYGLISSLQDQIDCLKIELENIKDENVRKCKQTCRS